MMIKNNHKTNTSKKLRKVKKRWIVVASLIGLATVGTYSTVENHANASVIVQNQVNVSNGDELIAALDNVNINQINVVQDVHLDSIKHGVELPFYNGSKILVNIRDLTINLNGHQLNFNDIKFTFKKTDSGNQININNGKVLSNGSGPIFLSGDANLQLMINLNRIDYGTTQLTSPNDDKIQVNIDELITNSNAAEDKNTSSNESSESSHSASESTNSEAIQPSSNSSLGESLASSSHSIESEENTSLATSSVAVNNSNAAIPNHSVSFAPSSSTTHSSSSNLFATTPLNGLAVSATNHNDALMNRSVSLPINSGSNDHSLVSSDAKTNEAVSHDKSNVDNSSTNQSNAQLTNTDKDLNKQPKQSSKVKYIRIKTKRLAKKIKVYKKINFKTNQFKLGKKLVVNKKYRVIATLKDKKGKLVYKTTAGYVFDNKRLIKVK